MKNPIKWLLHSGSTRRKETLRRWKHNFTWWHRNGRHNAILKHNGIFSKKKRKT